MNIKRIGCVVLTAIVLSVGGCVELTGQRLSWRYDAEKDELTALLFYDGIHNTPEDAESATQKLTEFVKNGDIMIADWFGHIDMSDIRSKLQSYTNLSPGWKRLYQRMLTSVHTHPIGHYRDAAGHIGAAQSITITEASKLVDAINACLNEELTDNGESNDPTQRLMAEAAKKNHAWLKLDGNAIVYTMPVDRGDWAKMKAAFFSEGMIHLGDDGLLNADSPPQLQSAQIKRSIRRMTQLLTSAPISYIEQGGMVTIRLGDPAASNTLRYRVHEQTEKDFTNEVTQQVPTDLDAAMAKYLLDDKHTPNADLDAIIAFGPPEQQVAAMVHAALSDDATGANALAKLKSWAAQWNVGHSYPQAPTQAATDAPDPEAAYLQSWDTWLKQMAIYPVDSRD